MTPLLRKFTLTAHVACSVGWLGAVVGFLVLAVAGLSSQDAQVVRAAYLAMELTGWFVVVPFCLAALSTGVVQSLGTEWGLFRHYWVVAKLLITVLATILLLVHMRPVGHLARVVAETTLARGELAGLRIQLVADAGAALVALVAATALSVYKPWGRTPFGPRKQRKQRERREAVAAGGTDAVPDRSLPAGRTWGLYALLGVGGLVLLVVVLHLVGVLGGH